MYAVLIFWVIVFAILFSICAGGFIVEINKKINDDYSYDEESMQACRGIGIICLIATIGFTWFSWNIPVYDSYYKIEEPDKVCFFTREAVIEKAGRTFHLPELNNQFYFAHPEEFVLVFEYTNTRSDQKTWTLDSVKAVHKSKLEK